MRDALEDGRSGRSGQTVVVRHQAPIVLVIIDLLAADWELRGRRAMKRAAGAVSAPEGGQTCWQDDHGAALAGGS
jgi:hypothetical protein